MIDGAALIRVQVDNTLFRIHSFHLRRNTTCLDDRLGRDGANGAAAYADDHPLVLVDVSEREFNALLWFFYEAMYNW